MVFGATTFRENAAILLSGGDPHSSDEWNVKTLRMPASGRTGITPILTGTGDFDLELLESRILDGHTHELVYRPTLH